VISVTVCGSASTSTCSWRAPVGGLQLAHELQAAVTYRYDRVVAAAGLRFDGRPLGALSPDRRRTGRLPDMAPDHRSRSQPGLYLAGR
jgi:hypothetical protein